MERRPPDQASYEEGDERQDNCALMAYGLLGEPFAVPTDYEQEEKCGSRNPDRPGKSPSGSDSW